MASLSNKPSLSINVDAGSDRATIQVTGTVRFLAGDLADMQNGHRFVVRAQMFGSDDGPDDNLGITIGPRVFTDSQSNTVTYSLVRSNVPVDKLDEDGLLSTPEDNVYARVRLTKDTLPGVVLSQRKSNIINENF